MYNVALLFLHNIPQLITEDQTKTAQRPAVLCINDRVTFSIFFPDWISRDTNVALSFAHIINSTTIDHRRQAQPSPETSKSFVH